MSFRFSAVRSAVRLVGVATWSGAVTIVGSVHSHPSGNYNPSSADLQLFSKHGTTHMIIGFPFTPGTWRGYDGAGNPRKLEIVD